MSIARPIAETLARPAQKPTGEPMPHERPGTLSFPLAVQNRTTCKPVREHGISSVLLDRIFHLLLQLGDVVRNALA